MECGDYSKGVARIKCTNAECGNEYFRPFSCKVFHLCPSCSQKRTLLFREYMNERLLLLLPHRQIVFTFPKVLRVFFRHGRRLYGEISKLVYRMIQKFYQPQPAVRLGPALEDAPDQSVSALESRSAWARLLAKVYEVDLIGGSFLHSKQREPLALHPLWFPDAGPRLSRQPRLRGERPVITDPQQCLRILRHLIKTGTAPPGLDAASLN